MSEKDKLFGMLGNSWEEFGCHVLGLPLGVRRSIMDIVEAMELSGTEEQAVWALLLEIAETRRPF